MLLLNQITINRPSQQPSVIQLLQGDLSAVPKEHAADILILSAYPGSYVPVPKTLIAALNDKGLSVEALAKDKAFDLRDQLNCWLSKTLTTEQQAQFNFRKILCFEPWHQSGDQVAVIGNIFRCINTFAFSESNNVIAMPVLASGKQKVPFAKMLPAMLDASIFWLESGLPLTCIKLVLHSDEQAAIALPVFIRARQQNELKQSLKAGSITGIDALKQLETTKQAQLPGEEPMTIIDAEIKELAKKNSTTVGPEPISRFTGISSNTPIPAVGGQARQPTTITPPPNEPSAISNQLSAGDVQHYDYFISYAHKHAQEVEAFVTNLLQANAKLQVFYDKSSIPVGGLWIKQISDAIQKAKKVLIFLSPEYSNSPVCWDEFQCAKLVEYNSKTPMIQTIYLYNDTAMPPIMGIYSYADCREGDKDKLQKIATALCEAAV